MCLMPCCFVRPRAQPDIDTEDHEEPGEMAGKAPVQERSEEMQFLKKGGEKACNWQIIHR
jgi:hypothetical protein